MTRRKINLITKEHCAVEIGMDKNGHTIVKSWIKWCWSLNQRYFCTHLARKLPKI